MHNIRWKLVGRVLLAAALAYIAVFLLAPGHVVQSYVRWGYPPWSHFVAGGLFLLAAILLPFPRTRRLGAAIACGVLATAAVSCAVHGDWGHAVQGPPLIALVLWLVLDRSKAVDV
jgi:hypothetical protein